MLRIDPEEGDEDGEAKPVKIKIDQSLFTYAAKSQKVANEEQINSAGHVQSNPEQGGVHQPVNPNMGHQQYAVISSPVGRVCKFLLKCSQEGWDK